MTTKYSADADLVSAKAGDRAAIERLWSVHHLGLIKTVCRQYLDRVPSCVLDDLVQEAYRPFVDSIKHHRADRCKFTTYLGGNIAKHLKHISKRSRFKMLPQLVENQGKDYQVKDDPLTMAPDHRTHDTEKLLAGLTDTQKAVVAMRMEGNGWLKICYELRMPQEKCKDIFDEAAEILFRNGTITSDPNQLAA